MDARRDHAHIDRSQIATRLRRVTHLTAMMTVVAIASSLVANLSVDWNVAWTFPTYILALVAPGLLMVREPRRAWAWLWTFWTLPLAAMGMGLVMWTDMPWILQLSCGAIGSIFVLVLIIMPIVCIATREPCEAVPRARLRR